MTTIIHMKKTMISSIYKILAGHTTVPKFAASAHQRLL